MDIRNSIFCYQEIDFWISGKLFFISENVLPDIKNSDVQLITDGGRPHMYEYRNIRKYGWKAPQETFDRFSLKI